MAAWFPGALSSPLLMVPWEAQGRKASSESTELLGLVGGHCLAEGSLWLPPPEAILWPPGQRNHQGTRGLILSLSQWERAVDG